VFLLLYHEPIHTVLYSKSVPIESKVYNNDIILYYVLYIIYTIY